MMIFSHRLVGIGRLGMLGSNDTFGEGEQGGSRHLQESWLGSLFSSLHLRRRMVRNLRERVITGSTDPYDIWGWCGITWDLIHGPLLCFDFFLFPGTALDGTMGGV
jgi:hypothetical protein